MLVKSSRNVTKRFAQQTSRLKLIVGIDEAQTRKPQNRTLNRSSAYLPRCMNTVVRKIAYCAYGRAANAWIGD